MSAAAKDKQFEMLRIAIGSNFKNVCNRFSSVLKVKNNWQLNNCVKRMSEAEKLKQESKEDVKVTFIKGNNQKVTVTGKVGDSLLDVIINNDVDIDGYGACEGTLCCSSCHLIFKREDFELLKPKASDEELDLLDLAFGLTETSRLGCQIKLSKELNGIEIRVPEGIHDARTN